MKRITARAVKVLNARPEDAYATLADYRHGHPNILPPQNLYDLQVEEGGYGAGTVLRVKSRLLGVEQSFHHRVSEPEPGRVIFEEEIDAANRETNTFTVTPVEQGRKSRVEILVTMNASPGFKGLVERLLVPGALSAVLRTELDLLEKVARQRAGQAVNARQPERSN